MKGLSAIEIIHGAMYGEVRVIKDNIGLTTDCKANKLDLKIVKELIGKQESFQGIASALKLYLSNNFKQERRSNVNLFRYRNQHQNEEPNNWIVFVGMKQLSFYGFEISGVNKMILELNGISMQIFRL